MRSHAGAGPLLGRCLGQCPDSAHATAYPPGQAPHRIARDPTQRRNGQTGPRGKAHPSADAERGRPRMAGGGEGRRKKRDGCPIAPRPAQVRQGMRRAGRCAAASQDPRPAPTAQMHPGAQGRRQPHIARDHQRQPPITADAREVAADRGSFGMRVVPQHHPRDAAWQAGCGRSRIGQPVGVGEQPQHRQRVRPQPTRRGSSPCDEFQVSHRFSPTRPPPEAVARGQSSVTVPRWPEVAGSGSTMTVVR